MAKIPDDDMLTFEEVAALFRMTARNLRRQIATGHFPPAHGQGHTQYYTREEVKAAMLFYGRWCPQPEPPDPDNGDETLPTKSGQKRPNST